MKNRDHIIAVLIGLLGGYYLDFIISLDRVLYYFLPEMSTRHLPRYYSNLLTAVLGGYIAYLIYCLIKKKMKKKGLIISSLVTLISIALIISSYGIHTRLMLKRVNDGIPNSIMFRIDSSVMFIEDSHNGSRGSGFGSNIEVFGDNVYKEDFSRILKDLKKVKVDDVKNYEKYEGDITLFMDYTVFGEWYSRIMSYSPRGLSERIGPFRDERVVIYEKSSELDDIIGELINITKDIESVSMIRLSDYDRIWGRDKIEIEGKYHKDFKEHLRNMEIITPSNEDIDRYKEYFEDGIRKEDKGIYALEFSNGNNDDDDFRFQRALLYDSENKTLVYSYEGPYYRVDLDKYLDK